MPSGGVNTIIPWKAIAEGYTLKIKDTTFTLRNAGTNTWTIYSQRDNQNEHFVRYDGTIYTRNELDNLMELLTT